MRMLRDVALARREHPQRFPAAAWVEHRQSSARPP